MSQRIVQERLIAAPLGRVYAAWTDPASLAIWMGPGADFAAADVTLDLRVGGRFEIVMHEVGETKRSYRQTGEYLEIIPNERLVMTWVSHWIAEDEAATRVAVHFEAVGTDKTRLRLVHDELPASQTYDGHQSGWRTIVDRLAAELARTSVQQHQRPPEQQR